MNKKQILSIFTFFVMLNMVVMANFTEEWGYSGIEQLVTSFDIEVQEFSLMLMLFNLSIDIIFIYFISVKTLSIFNLADYIISRSSWRRFLGLAVKEISKTNIVIVSIKCCADLIFVLPKDYVKVFYLAFLYATTLFTLGLFFIILIRYRVSTTIALFITISSTLFLKVLSHKVSFASIFVVAAPNYLNDYLLLSGGKIINIMLLLFILFWRGSQDLTARKVNLMF